jgi:hypothetical protein
VGLTIDQDRFEEGDYGRFADRLRVNLEALAELLERPGFGVGPRSVGAELEMCLVDDGCRPLPFNKRVVREAVDERFELELDRFNLEFNSHPSPLAGRPFSALSRELEDALAGIGQAAARYGGRVAIIGILPTLRIEDLQASSMTDVPRYRALSAGIRRLHSGPFHVTIDGEDPLEESCDDVTFEGANTSLQLHLRIDPGDFGRVHRALQIAIAPTLAAAGNSPTFLGHRLWEETRIALFKQSVETRRSRGAEHGEPRVGFGTRWVRTSALELFTDSVTLHEPLLPIVDDEDPLACTRAAGTPRLYELRLHHGTVWRWNRAIYDPTDGGHLRIEMRALPAGPSVVDMMANAAFLIGLGVELAEEGLDPPPFTFEEAHGNFYRAAQLGLRAPLVWPVVEGSRSSTVIAQELIPGLVSLAARGLARSGVDGAEADRLLTLFAERAASGRTGARWQRECLARREAELGRERALAVMLEAYLDRSGSGEPVHRWTTGG